MPPFKVLSRRQTLSARANILALLGIVLVLGSCDRATQSPDVVAVVDHQTITLADLAAEARAEKLPDDGEAVKSMLDRVISRVLLAQYAHGEKLDAYPGYPNDLARVQQSFLAGLALQKVVTQPAAPTDNMVRSFIEAHPLLFARRTQLEIDQIAAEGHLARSIRLEPSLHLISGKLSDMGASYRRRRLTTDTSALTEDLAAKLLALKPGGVLFVDEPGQTLAMSVLDRRSLTATAATQAAEARQLINRRAVDQQVESEMKTLRAGASITYQPGYRPTGSRPPP